MEILKVTKFFWGTINLFLFLLLACQDVARSILVWLTLLVSRVKRLVPSQKNQKMRIVRIEDCED